MKSKVWFFALGVLLCDQAVWGADRVKLELVGSIDVAAHVIDVSVCLVGQFACVAGFWDDGRWRGLKVVDFSQPAHPTVVGECETSTTLHRVASAGHYVFGISGDGRMDVIDVHNPAEPILVKTLQVAVTNGEDLEVLDSYVLVSGATAHTPTEWTGSLHVFDVRTPESPFEVGAFELGDTAWWPMDYADGFAYFVTPQSEGDGFEFQVIDLNNPSTPSRAWQGTFLGPTPHPTTVTVSEGFAYVGFGAMKCDGGVIILEVTDPSHVTQIGRYTPTPGRCVHEISVLGNYAYLAMCSVDEFIDVSETPTSRLAGSYDNCDFGHTTEDVVLTDTHAHIVNANGYHLLSITELPAITRNVSQNGKLNLQWNQPAQGMKLQRATSLAHPDWQDMHGSEAMTGVELPLWRGPE